MEKVNKSIYIYILYDPTFISNKFYVGKTWQKNPRKRLVSGHLNPTNLKKNIFNANWIKSLLSRNVKPNMHIVTILSPDEDWVMAEISLIQFLRWCGLELTNLTDGGEGRRDSGWHHTIEAKNKMSMNKKGKLTWNKGLIGYQTGEKNPFFGKTHTLKTKEVLRKMVTGRKALLETRQKISISNKEKGGWNKNTDATTKYLPILRGESNSAAKITEQQVIKIRDLYAAGNYTFIELGKLFNISNVSIANIVRRKTWAHI